MNADKIGAKLKMIRNPCQLDISYQVWSLLYWPRASPRGPNSYYVVEVPETIYFFCLISPCLDIFDVLDAFRRFWTLFWTFWTFLDAFWMLFWTFLDALDAFRRTWTHLDVFGHIWMLRLVVRSKLHNLVFFLINQL